MPPAVSFALWRHIQLEAEVFNPPDIFPLTSIVNKSCNIEPCVKTILPIIQNLIVSQGLELILSMCRRTTMYYVRSAYPDLGMGPKFSKVFNPLLPLKYNGSRGLNTFENFGPIFKIRDTDLIQWSF